MDFDFDSENLEAIDWDPVLPPYIVAHEAFQILLELNRQHPGDPDLIYHLDCAFALLDFIWNVNEEKRKDSV